MTLSELKTLIQNYTENEETTFVSTLNDFIVSAEDRLFQLIQLDYFRKNVTGNLTVGNTYLTAPSDFLMSFSLAVIDSNTNDYHYLDKKHTSFMRAYSDDAVVSLTTYTVTVASGVNTYGSGNKYYLNGINIVGLRRGNVSNKDIKGLTEAYKDIFKTSNLTENLSKLNGQFKENLLVNEVLEFINKDKKRPICTPFLK